MVRVMLRLQYADYVQNYLRRNTKKLRMCRTFAEDRSQKKYVQVYKCMRQIFGCFPQTGRARRGLNLGAREGLLELGPQSGRSRGCRLTEEVAGLEPGGERSWTKTELSLFWSGERCALHSRKTLRILIPITH